MNLIEVKTVILIDTVCPKIEAAADGPYIILPTLIFICYFGRSLSLRLMFPKNKMRLISWILQQWAQEKQRLTEDKGCPKMLKQIIFSKTT